MNIKKTSFWLVYVLMISVLCMLPTFQFNPAWMYDTKYLWTHAINIVPFKSVIYYASGLIDGSLNFNIAVGFFVRNMLIGFPLAFLIPMTVNKKVCDNGCNRLYWY